MVERNVPIASVGRVLYQNVTMNAEAQWRPDVGAAISPDVWYRKPVWQVETPVLQTMSYSMS